MAQLIQLNYNENNDYLHQSDSPQQIQPNGRLGRPQIQSGLRNKFAKEVAQVNYFQSLSKCLLYIYNSLIGQNNHETRQYRINGVSQFHSQFLEFIENKAAFIKNLQYLTKNRFQQFQSMLEENTNFTSQYLTQHASKTLTSALRNRRLYEVGHRSSSKPKPIQIREIDLKCLVMGSILLVGIGKIDLQQKSEQSLQDLFNRIVPSLVKKSKLFTPATFKYITDNWDAIIVLISQEQLESMEIDQVQSKQSSSIFAEKINKEQKKEKEKIIQKSYYEDSLSQKFQFQNSESQEYEGSMNYSNFDCQNSFNYQYNNHMLQNEFIDDIDREISSYLSSSDVKSPQQKNDNEKNKEQKTIQKSYELMDFQARKQLLTKRAQNKNLFNYKKVNSKRKSSKKSTIPSSNSRKSKSKKPHPQHKKRQIDQLIDIIIEDEFSIAHSLANYIYHALKVENFKLKLQC